jgi:hypothetical protein
MQAQVKAGWFPDLNSLVGEAVRRYLETHDGDLKESSYVRMWRGDSKAMADEVLIPGR